MAEQKNHVFKHKNPKALSKTLVTSTGFQLEQFSVLCSEGEYSNVSIEEKNPLVIGNQKPKTISFDLSADDMEEIGNMLINQAKEIKNNRSALV